MDSQGQSDVASSLRWADEIDEIDSDTDGIDLIEHKPQQSEWNNKEITDESNLNEVEPQSERCIVDKSDRSANEVNERAFGINKERSFAEVSADSRYAADSDRQRSMRVIDVERQEYSSRDRDAMNRRSSKNSKKPNNRKGKFEQTRYEEGSWRSSSSFGDGNMRRGNSFNSRNEDERGFYSINRRNKEENGSSW